MTCEPIRNNNFLEDLENDSLFYLNNIRNKDGLKGIQDRIIGNEYNLDEGDSEYNLFEDPSECLKIWTFGALGDSFCNILVDQSKGIQMLKEIKNDVMAGFEQMTQGGVLCNEPLRGVKFNIQDAKIHSDKAHRGGGQIIPMTQRVCNACSIYNEPRLMEAMYKVEVVVKSEHVNSVYNTLSQRRGEVIDDELKGNDSRRISGYLAVANSFGFDGDLKGSTQGTAFTTMQFSHWSVVNGDPYGDKSVEDIVLNIRRRKGMKEALPQFNDYFDKIN